MLVQHFTIDTLPFSLTIPGTGALPNYVLTIGGLKLEEGRDYFTSGRTLTIPDDLVELKFVATVEGPTGSRSTFSSRRAFPVTGVSIVLNGVTLSQSLPNPEAEVLSPTQIKVNIPVYPYDRLYTIGFFPINFSIGASGEYREVA